MQGGGKGHIEGLMEGHRENRESESALSQLKAPKLQSKAGTLVVRMPPGPNSGLSLVSRP